ncbi:hypothetical protein FNF27_00774 [Cafeteria roenbergensis]|uniref:AAA+ ATPase domain-containing protein n=1 Tax=Cafeteria roenbergensis TaxID=33653 RepID=A0A5A8EK14_CAFRO|nr:hypothetical protein FNF27_00774 [Cafeteria roenbergensis]
MASAAPAKTMPWVEKYRPRRMDDVAHQDEAVRALKKAMETGNLPHLLFYGPPGTGKTSTIHAAAAELYGPTLVKKLKMELNASDERGIQVVREKIKNFASGVVGSSAAVADADGKMHAAPAFKLIILDEADSLTSAAQTALRRTMEVHSKVTRFCLICNYVSRIIEPLVSRCAVFRFKPLAPEAMRSRLQHIAEGEKLVLAEATYDALLRISHGDMRKAITTMQSGAALFGGDLSPAQVIEAAGELPDPMADRILNVVAKTDFRQVQTAAKDTALSGYSMAAVVDKLFDRVVGAADMSDLVKAGMLERLARASRAVAEGCDEHLHMLDLLLAMQRCKHGWVVPTDSDPDAGEL